MKIKMATPPTTAQDQIFTEAAQKMILDSANVHRLSSKDFVNVGPRGIDLRDSSIPCAIILFHTDNRESVALVEIFSYVAQQIPGTFFGAINMINNYEIASAFVSILTDSDHPYQKFGAQGYPYILVYRQGIPRGFYNGERSAQALANYSLTLACSTANNEMRIDGGVQLNANASMPSYAPYVDTDGSKVKATISTDFNTNPDIRKYDPSKSVEYVNLVKNGLQTPNQTPTTNTAPAARPTENTTVPSVVGA